MIPLHFGLTFSKSHASQANERRTAPELSGAWASFDSLRGRVSTDAVIQAVVEGATWRLLDDGAAGERGVQALIASASGDDYAVDIPLVDGCRRTVALAQAFECLRDHPAFDVSAQAAVLVRFEDRISRLNDRVIQPLAHEQAWLAAVNIAVAVVLERESLFRTGADTFKHIIDTVQPHGYISAIVEPRDAATLFRTIQAAHGLVLAAEIASQAGEDLWAYERRGVSVMTSALYPLYYYYYPEKWRWFDGLTPEPVQAVFRQHAAFLELVNRRSAGTVRAVKLILDEVRPVFDALGGGPVSLTHEVAPVVRRGLFRR